VKTETLYAGFFVIRKEDRWDNNGRDVMEYIDFFNNFNFHFDPTSALFSGASQNYAIPDRRKVAAYELNEVFFLFFFCFVFIFLYLFFFCLFN
jgi:hypothetical protein